MLSPMISRSDGRRATPPNCIVASSGLIIIECHLHSGTCILDWAGASKVWRSNRQVVSRSVQGCERTMRPFALYGDMDLRQQNSSTIDDQVRCALDLMAERVFRRYVWI